MPRLPSVDARKVVAALKRAGFEPRRQRGSHLTMRHPETGRMAVVPRHTGDIRRGTLSSILRQAGISRDEFARLLKGNR